jgi:hypothetical protein
MVDMLLRKIADALACVVTTTVVNSAARTVMRSSGCLCVGCPAIVLGGEVGAVITALVGIASRGSLERQPADDGRSTERGQLCLRLSWGNSRRLNPALIHSTFEVENTSLLITCAAQKACRAERYHPTL